MTLSAWQRATPAAYSAAKTRRMVERWSSPLGLAVRRMAPTAWPGVPASAILGQTASVRDPRSNTTDTAKAQPFHEVGAFQTPAGPRNGPAPNPDPNADHNRWGALASSDLVVQLLGRPASMVPEAWRTSMDDQVAVGIASLRRDLAGITRKLPPALLPQNEGSLYAVFLAFCAFSRGASGAWSRLQPALLACADVPEAVRVPAIVHWIATSDHTAAKVAGKPGVARLCMRSGWKLASGEVLARSVGEDVAWYGARSLDDEAAVTRRAFGV